VTGVSAIGFVAEFLARLGERTGVEITAVAVENHLFGECVTVCGLVAGNDIITALTGVDMGTSLLLPDVMLKEGEGVFLDDVSLEELGKRLGCRVMAFDSTPKGCYQAIRDLAIG
jgi:NifB/MoaA-like Fe-S oxidoreductase